MTPPREDQLREQLLRFGRLLYDRHLLVGLDGNLSVRLTSDLLLCTRAGCHKGMLSDEDLVVIDLEGRKHRGQGKPTSEMGMHIACYRARPDVGAIIHAHPPIAVALTIAQGTHAGAAMSRCVLPEVVLSLGIVPTLPYRTTGSDALARQVGAAIVSHDALMLERHGAVCVGDSLMSAFCKLETVENMALVIKNAEALGGVSLLPADEAIRLRRMGLKRYGGPPAALARVDDPHADLPQEIDLPLPQAIV